MFDRAVIEEGLLATSSALLVPLEGLFVVFVALVCLDRYEWVVLHFRGRGPAVAVLVDRARTLDRSSTFVDVVPMRLGASVSW